MWEDGSCGEELPKHAVLHMWWVWALTEKLSYTTIKLSKTNEYNNQGYSDKYDYTSGFGAINMMITVLEDNCEYPATANATSLQVKHIAQSWIPAALGI